MTIPVSLNFLAAHIRHGGTLKEVKSTPLKSTCDHERPTGASYHTHITIRICPRPSALLSSPDRLGIRDEHTGLSVLPLLPLRPKLDSSQPTVPGSHHAPGDALDASNEPLRESRGALVFVVQGVGENKLSAEGRQLSGAGYLPVFRGQNVNVIRRETCRWHLHSE